MPDGSEPATDRSVGQLRTLVLDVIERLAILETRSGFADQQRLEIMKLAAKLGERLENLTLMPSTVETLTREVAELQKQMHQIELEKAQIRGGVSVANWVWNLISAVAGASLAFLMQKFGK